MTARTLLGWLALTLLSGCADDGPAVSPTYPVRGVVKYQNKPAAGAVVYFHPAAGVTHLAPHATANADGAFELSTHAAGDGAPRGSYRVTVSWKQPVAGDPDSKSEDRDAGREQLPVRYQNPARSGLTAEVVEGENTLPPFLLSR